MVKVKEIMRKHVITISPATSLKEAANIMVNNKVGSAIIMEKDRPVGIITSEDIVSVVAKGSSPVKLKVKEFVKKDFITASPEDDILKVVKIMVKKGVKRVPIIKQGKLEGILSDKEILLTTPEMIDVLSEKLKARVERVASPKDIISGICEYCEGYSDMLAFMDGRWICEDCKD